MAGAARIAALVAAALIAPSAASAELLARFEPERSTIHFTLGATLHTVHGSAELLQGEIRFDAAGGPATGRVVVDAGSLETGNRRRDRRMHRRILDSETYPEIALIIERIEGELATLDTSRIVVHGRLALHGSTHEVEIPVEATLDGHRFLVRATFSVPYVEWGLPDPSSFVLRVAKEVVVTLEAAGTLSRATTPDR